MEPVVHFRSAIALLGRFPALAGVDLNVARGQIVLLRGPNGAGKTTLLRACAGLVPVVSGEARVLGCDLREDPRAVRPRVGLLGHSRDLYDDLTVEENVRFWGKAVRADPDDIEAALSLLGLDGRLRHTRVGRLSAGQQRRTSLACLLSRRPELWLLDEPHAGLDGDTRDKVDALVRRATSQGATVLFASHELDRAETLADLTVDMAAGMTGTAEAGCPSAEGDSSPGGSRTATRTVPDGGTPGSSSAPEAAGVA